MISMQELFPACVARCPVCGNYARLENGDCVYCAARAAARRNLPASLTAARVAAATARRQVTEANEAGTVARRMDERRPA